MATSLIDTVIHWRKKLERATDDDIINYYIHKLGKVPITIEVLQETHIGKCVRQIAKRQDSVGQKALTILKKWRDEFANQVNGKNSSSKFSSNCIRKKENVTKESSSIKSSSKQDVKDRKSNHKKLSPSEPKHKLKHESLKTDLSCGKLEIYNCEASSPSLYTYEKIEAGTEQRAKYKDYDPHADSNEGYNPECPELCPGSKFLKVEKNGTLTDIYEPISIKRKSNSQEPIELKNKTKKLKNESAVFKLMEYSLMQSAAKKEKHSFHKDKSNDKSTKKDSSNQLSECKLSKHKSSDSKKSKDPKKKDSSEKNVSTKLKSKINSTEEFTSSEVRFEDCLGLNDIVTAKKKKSTKPVSAASSKKPFCNSNKTSGSISSSKQIVQHKSSSSTESKVSNVKSSREKLQLEVPKPSSKLVEVDIISTLPETLPNYRPLPQRSIELGSSKRRVLTDEEAIRFISSRREKTSVYSGRKSCSSSTGVPTLFHCCSRILIENIDAIEYMGEVPYFLIKHILERCTALQLYNIEHFNHYLLEDTNELWEIHCKRDYKLLVPDENETWRELYLRAFEEREKKLKNITANITKSMSKTSQVRQVKLAYVDSFVKPPRDVARRQAKHGTALPVSHPVKAGPPSKVSPKPTAPAVNSAASRSSMPSTSIIKTKPKIAPLMAKTLKSMKLCFRR